MAVKPLRRGVIRRKKKAHRRESKSTQKTFRTRLTVQQERRQTYGQESGVGDKKKYTRWDKT